MKIRSRKGQIAKPVKMMLQLLSMVLLIMTIVGTIMLMHTYIMTWEERTDVRNLIDFGENVLSAPCLVYEQNGNMIKGILDKEKLDMAQGQDISDCISISEKSVAIDIVDWEGHVWTFCAGTECEVCDIYSLTYPATVWADGSILTASLKVSYCE
jgi:hypothetical protein